MRLSVVICTRDRSEPLRDALHSLLIQQVSSSAFEVVVVDNSEAGTAKDVVTELQSGSAVPLRYLLSPTDGLSFARNVGVADSQAAYVAFIDDDAVAEPQWVGAVLAAFDLSQADAVGGPVSLRWPAPSPDWLGPELQGFLGRLDLGTRPRFLQWPEYPFGLNCAIRRDTLQSLSGFREDLGRARATLLSGEERDFFRRVYETGGRVFFAPRAVVYHTVPIERLRKRFFRRRSYWEGRSQRRLERADPWARERSGVLRSLAASPLVLARAFRSLVRERPAEAFSAECALWWHLGYLWESALQSARASRDA